MLLSISPPSPLIKDTAPFITVLFLPIQLHWGFVADVTAGSQVSLIINISIWEKNPCKLDLSLASTLRKSSSGSATALPGHLQQLPWVSKVTRPQANEQPQGLAPAQREKVSLDSLVPALVLQHNSPSTCQSVHPPNLTEPT